MRNRVLELALLLLLAAGCSPAAAPDEVSSDITRGHLIVACAPEAHAVMGRCVAAFEALYPNAHIELQTRRSRQGVAALFAARAEMAVITREIVPEERQAAVQGKFEFECYRFARDAAVILVNAANPVQHLTLDEVRRIYSGEAKRWTEFGGAALAIQPVAQSPDADLTEFFIEEVLGGETIRARSIAVESGDAVVRTVREHPEAIGYVTLAESGQGTRPLALATIKGVPYFAPDLERVHEGQYPVTRFYNMVVRANGPALTNGFITYVTSLDGQKLIRESGLVPTTVPVRFVRRSSMLRSHHYGDSTNTP